MTLVVTLFGVGLAAAGAVCMAVLFVRDMASEKAAVPVRSQSRPRSR